MQELSSNKRIKTDPYIVPQTDHELIEFAKCADPKTGPVYFAENYFKVRHTKLGLMDLKFYPYQRDLMQSYVDNDFTINMCGRQKGKTTVATAYILWLAMFRSHTNILIAANKEKNTIDIMKRIKLAYEECPNFMREAVEAYNVKSIDFCNKSSIQAETTTATTGRGFSISLLYLDEFAFVPPNIAEEFWTSLLPTLSDGGRCIITSTPNNRDDVFADIWFEAIDNTDEDGNVLCAMDERYGTPVGPGANGFQAFLAKWDRDGLLMHTPRDEEWKQRTIKKLGPGGKAKFAREHDCEFVTWEETLVDSLVIDQIMRGDEEDPDDHGDVEDPVKNIGEVKWWKRPDEGYTYIVCLDPAVGTGGDYAAIQVIEAPTMEQVAEWRNNRKGIYDQIKCLQEILEFIAEETGYDDLVWEGTAIFWSVETNGIGEAANTAIEALGPENFPGQMVSEPRKAKKTNRRRKGLYTSKENKMEACFLLKSLLENDRSLALRSRELVKELGSFVRSGMTYKAKAGRNDDLADAMLLCMRLLDYAAKQDEEIAGAINPYTENEEDEGYEDDFEGEDAPMPFGIL